MSSENMPTIANVNDNDFHDVNKPLVDKSAKVSTDKVASAWVSLHNRSSN
jgi:hypothetical protein